MATQTGPGAWWDQPDVVLATALAVLDQRAREVERAHAQAVSGG